MEMKETPMDGLGYTGGSYCDTFACEWVEEYYGWRCSKCGCFYAFGQAPWEDFGEEYGEDDEY